MTGVLRQVQFAVSVLFAILGAMGYVMGTLGAVRMEDGEVVLYLVLALLSLNGLHSWLMWAKKEGR